MRYEEFKIERRAAIRAEIEAAIRLLVSEEYVPAHVLSFAAKGQLRGIAKARKIETFDDEAEQYIRQEHLKNYRRLVNFAYNFMKHSDEDPDLHLDRFRPETTVIAIFSATINYGIIYGQRSLPMTIMFAWSLSRHPSFARETLQSRITDWKAAFGYPEGKPLNEALRALRDMVAVLDQLPQRVLDQLISPDVSAVIEQ
jgi:hypothetical protein